ncbi:MAG: substrate-binding domain-containing protein [Janthinobacterium lividum]
MINVTDIANKKAAVQKVDSPKQDHTVSRGHSLHAHVETIIRSRIQDGSYPPGILLPGRRALCEDLGIAPSTLEKAIKHLLADGTLRSESRRGTFVSDTLSRHESSSGDASGPQASRLKDVANYRIGIVDTTTDVTTMRSDQTWFDYMIVHAAESKISSQGSQSLYLPPRLEAGELLQRQNAHGTQSAYLPPWFEPRKFLEGAVSEFQNSGADAIIIIAYHDEKEAVEEAVNQAKAAGMAPVVVSSTPHEWPCPHVWTDSLVAGRQAAEHLLELGHRRIVFIAPYENEWQERRILGAKDAVRSAGLSDDRLVVVRRRGDDPVWDTAYDDAADAGATLFARAYAELAPLSAVIGPNDWVSVGIEQAIKQIGLSLGSEISLVSFDDTPLARQFGLSSIRFPLEQLGAEAALLAVRAANGEKTHHRLRIGGSLILRGSTAIYSPRLV